MVHLRSGRVDDSASIVSFWRESEAEPTTTDDPERIEHLIATDPDAVIVAEDLGRMVGTVIAGWDGWRGAIYRLAVAPDCRGQGIGRLLVDEAVRRLDAAGATRLSAIVVNDDDTAMEFWRAVGWDLQSARSRFVLNL